MPKEPLKYLIAFADREKNLRKIIRYHMYSPMYYRTNLWGHSRRLSWLVREAVPRAEKLLGQNLDGAKAELLALVHDDPEIIIGDIQAGNKSKMPKSQLKKIEEKEKIAIDRLADKYPNRLGPYSYRELMIEAVDYSSPEAQLVSYFDKFDAFGEALHEVYSGNEVFTKRITNEYGEIPTPLEYYVDYLSQAAKHYPDITKLFVVGQWLFAPPKKLNFASIASQGKPHSQESLKTPVDYFPYSEWLAITYKYGDEEDINNLWQQQES